MSKLGSSGVLLDVCNHGVDCRAGGKRRSCASYGQVALPVDRIDEPEILRATETIQRVRDG